MSVKFKTKRWNCEIKIVPNISNDQDL
jgi:hypothetical protein